MKIGLLAFICLAGFSIIAPSVARADCYDDPLIQSSETPNHQSSLSSTSEGAPPTCPLEDTSD